MITPAIPAGLRAELPPIVRGPPSAAAVGRVHLRDDGASHLHRTHPEDHRKSRVDGDVKSREQRDDDDDRDVGGDINDDSVMMKNLDDDDDDDMMMILGLLVGRATAGRGRTCISSST
jgi:hypothetical protein